MRRAAVIGVISMSLFITAPPSASASGGACRAFTIGVTECVASFIVGPQGLQESVQFDYSVPNKLFLDVDFSGPSGLIRYHCNTPVCYSERHGTIGPGQVVTLKANATGVGGWEASGH